MKKHSVKRFSGFVKVGAGAALGVAALTAFVMNGHAPHTDATDIETVKNGTSAVVRVESSTAVSSKTNSERSSESFASSPKDDSRPIDINTATAGELQALSGIGEAKARAIIEYREEHGGFSDISEIKNVSGIGEKLFDSICENITVGNVSKPTHQETPSEPAQTAAFPININTATAGELQALSGIGEAKARAIIEYREEHGGFSDISEIKNVSGIGEKIFASIRENITVGNVSKPTQQETPSEPAQTAAFSININTATAEELQVLSGIGEAKARAIIEYREEHGGFSDIAEIKNVSGIGEKIFAKIRADITV